MSLEVELAKRIWELKQQMEAEVAIAKATGDKLKQGLADLQQYLITEGKNSTGHIAGVGVFTIVRENYPSVTKVNMPGFIGYLKEVGDDGIVQETIPSPTLKTYLKGALDKLTEEMLDDPDRQVSYESVLKVEHDSMSCSQLAVAYFRTIGVSTFEDIKLSHTKRGR